MKHVVAASLIAWLALAAVVRGARAESSTGGAFLLPGYGARAAGMAGAVGAVVDDESAVDWNPARIALAARAVGASFVQLVPGASLNLSQIAFVTPIAAPENGVARHAAGAMLSNLSADVAGGESYSENHLRAAYAFTPQPVVSVAIAAQLFTAQSGVDGFDAWGTSVDFAGRISLSEDWDVGIVGRDLFSRYTFDDDRDSRKETRIVVGLATRRLPFVVVSADAVRQYSSWSRAMVGAESDYIFSHLALRAGATFHNAGESRTAACFGASLRALDARLAVHYGVTIDDEQAFGTSHRVSLGVDI